MVCITRRSFLAGSAATAAPLAWGDIAPAKRRLLTTAWPAPRIEATLAPRTRFRPFPTSSDRVAWDEVPVDGRSVLIGTGEQRLKTPWEVLPATVFLDFQRTGNRSHYEQIRDLRRDKLQDLVVAECLEGKGRFIDEIVNGVWLTCEETFWGLPAHLGAQKAGVGLPDVREPIVDLFAAETASLLGLDQLPGGRLTGACFAACARADPTGN